MKYKKRESSKDLLLYSIFSFIKKKFLTLLTSHTHNRFVRFFSRWHEGNWCKSKYVVECSEHNNKSKNNYALIFVDPYKTWVSSI